MTFFNQKDKDMDVTGDTAKTVLKDLQRAFSGTVTHV